MTPSFPAIPATIPTSRRQLWLDMQAPSLVATMRLTLHDSDPRRHLLVITRADWDRLEMWESTWITGWKNSGKTVSKVCEVLSIAMRPVKSSFLRKSLGRKDACYTIWMP